MSLPETWHVKQKVSARDPEVFGACDNQAMNETYQSRLKKARIHQKIQQADAAAVTGKGRPYLSEFENGKKPGSLEVVLPLAELYDISLDYVFGRTPIPLVQKPENIAHDEKEAVLLAIWRKLSDDEKGGLMALLRARIKPDAA